MNTNSAPIQEALSDNLSGTMFRYSEHLNYRRSGCSSNPPNSLTNDGLFEELEEFSCKVDAEVAIPLEPASLLDILRDFLRIDTLNLLEDAIGASPPYIYLGYSVPLFSKRVRRHALCLRTYPNRNDCAHILSSFLSCRIAAMPFVGCLAVFSSTHRAGASGESGLYPSTAACQCTLPLQ